ncbi:MAG: hypothetical protein LUE17_17095, partial [Planctomycetaceae bacterium]|nr:hypothetical protein [Planctomycetaceae bacterium]
PGEGLTRQGLGEALGAGSGAEYFDRLVFLKSHPRLWEGGGVPAGGWEKESVFYSYYKIILSSPVWAPLGEKSYFFENLDLSIMS